MEDFINFLDRLRKRILAAILLVLLLVVPFYLGLGSLMIIAKLPLGGLLGVVVSAIVLMSFEPIRDKCSKLGLI